MKKNKQIAIAKEQRKVAKRELTNQITVALQTVLSNFTASKKAGKQVTKSAKQLVKKLAKENLTLLTAKEEPLPIVRKKKPQLTDKKEEKPE